MGKSKKALLFDYIKGMGEVSSADIYKWGDDNFSHRAKRNARQFAKDGKEKKSDKIVAFSKEGSALVWYRYVAKAPESKLELFQNQQNLSLGA